MKLELIREVSHWGNSGGVLLPKEWMGKQVQVILVDRSEEIRKEVLDILDKYLSDVLGIYLVGSYARNEQKRGSDIDVLVISGKSNREIESGKYNISIVDINSIKKVLMKRPLSILPRLREAKVLLNSTLLNELNETKIDKKSLKEYISETKSMLEINKALLFTEKDLAISSEIIYSLVLRLRGLYLTKSLLMGKVGSKKEFIRLTSKTIGKEADALYEIYLSVKNNVKTKKKLSKETVNKIVGLLEKELEGGLFNHSCEPNLGYKNTIIIVAMKDIKLGEELVFDYGMSESNFKPYTCNCGSQNCRKTITQDDWKDKELQNKHGEFFATYLKNRINNKA